MRGRDAAVAAAVTVWSLAVAAAFIHVPGYWWDETATIIMAGKPWEGFLATLRGVDAVHAAYYAGMRLWTGALGVSPLATRLPSALAVAGTSLVLLQLGRATLSGRAGVIAGVLYPLIPAVAWAAGEARSFALSALLAAAIVLALVRALADPRPWRWALLAVTIALAGWLFVFTVLLLPAALLLVTPAQWRRHRRALAVSVTAGLVGVLPLLGYALRQRAQVGWIPEYGWRDLMWGAAVEQYFRGSLPVAAVAWLALLLGAVLVWWSHPDSRRPLLAFAAGVVLPTLVLLASGPVLGTSYYWGRYLVFTAPALAMVAAIVLNRVTTPWAVATLGVVLVAASGPTLRERLDPLSKSSWLFAAETVAARAEPGDAMIAFSNHMTAARVIHEELASLPLLNETITPAVAAHEVVPSVGGPLEDVVVPNDVQVVWYFSDAHSRSLGLGNTGADAAILAAQGFRTVWASAPTGSQDLVITLLRR